MQFDIDPEDQYVFKQGDTVGFSWKTDCTIAFLRTRDGEVCGDRIQQPEEGKQVELASNEFITNVYFFQALYYPVDVFSA